MLQTAIRMFPTKSMVSASPKLIWLDFEDLTPFESVTDRYQHWGVYFSGAIAIEPSNPVFQPQSGTIVIMPQSHEITIAVRFSQPSSWVGASVCGSGCVILTAFDREGRQIDQVNTATHTFIASEDPDSEICPQRQLQLTRRGIATVMFHSSMPFVLNNFFFTQDI